MPRITQEQKQLNRERIITAASEGFKLHGVDGIGIQDLMKAAGMTNGGFYNHFASKDDLVLEVYRQGFADSLDTVAAVREAHPGAASAALHDLVDVYVSADHRDHPEAGCPSAALAVDAERHGAAPQNEYRQGLDGYITHITEMLLERAQQDGTVLTAAQARDEAMATLSQMVGALVIARAVAEADPDLSDEVLAATVYQITGR